MQQTPAQGIYSNRDKSLKSILEGCNAPAHAKIQALCILFNQPSASEFIKALGRSRGHFYRVVNNPDESQPLAADICQHLGVDPRDIWPPQEAVNS